MKRAWSTIGKAITGGVAIVAEAVAAGVLHGNALVIASAALGVAGVLGIYHAPYQPTTPAK